MKDNYRFLSDPLNKLSTILNTEEIFRNIITELIQIYMKNYQKYAENYMNNQLNLIIVIIVINTIIFGVFIVFGYMNLFKSINKYYKIVQIVKV